MNKIFSTALLSIIAFASASTISRAQTISTVAGCGLGDDSLAIRAELIGPVSVTRDKAGNTYIGDDAGYHIRKVNAAGVITTIAGNGVLGFSGDGGPATAASIGAIYGIGVDKNGNVYFTDGTFSVIRKVDAAGIITTIAGTPGTASFSGDNGPASAATLDQPTDLLVDTAGNIYFADWYNYRVRKINTAGIISTVVGNGGASGGGNNGPATASSLGDPFRIAMDDTGNLYVAAVQFQCITKVDLAGNIHIIAGTGAYAVGTDGDGGAATAATMTSPCGLAVDGAGNIYFSDIGNGRIRKVSQATGLMSTYAATLIAGYSGDGGPALLAQISTPEGLWCDSAGNLLICDADNNRIRNVDATTGIITTFAGRSALFGEGYAATSAEMTTPYNIAADAAGNVYIADYYNNRVRKLNVSTGVITTVAGTGIAGYDNVFSGDGGPATAAEVYNPAGVALDAAGNIYIAEQGDSRVRKVDGATGIITTIAGNGTAGYSGNGAPATAAMLNYPASVAVDNAGNVYVADEVNSRIRKINTAGIITTVAGNGFATYAADNVAATATPINYPTSVAVDVAGNIYIGDAGNYRIRMVDAAGIIHTLTGDGTFGYSGDNGPATDAQISAAGGITISATGEVIFADTYNDRIRVITADSNIITVAGIGTPGYSGDGANALLAQLNVPTGTALDHSGNLYIGDGNNFRVRKVHTTLAVQGVVKTNTENIAAYPNPTTGQLSIINAAGCNVTLYNILGAEIMKMTTATNKETMDLGNVANGVYTLLATDAVGARKVMKVVKE